MEAFSYLLLVENVHIYLLSWTNSCYQTVYVIFRPTVYKDIMLKYSIENGGIIVLATISQT